MSSPRKLIRAVALAGAVLALAPPAFAEGLGELRVFSHIGEIFRAEIKVLGMRPSFSTDCVVLDPALSDPESGLPRLRHAAIALDTAGQRLLITSRDRINEPALHLSLTVTCGTHLTRHYVALLSPPAVGAVAADPAPAAPAARATAPSPAAATPPARRASSATSRPAGKPHVPKTAAAASPAVPPAAPASPPPAGERLELSPPAAELADIEREIAALNAELQRLSAGGGAQSAETQTRILEMETRLVRMELHAARARLQPSGSPAAAPLAAAGEAPPPPVPAATPAAPETKPVDADAKPEAQKTPRRVDSDRNDDGMWYGLGALVLFGAGLGFYLMRRSSRREEAEVRESAVADGGRSASSAETKVRVRPAAPVAATAPAAADTLPPEPIPEFSRDIAEPDDLSPDAEVVKLAEVMSAFGRLDGAIEALRSFIREHPDGALRPRLFLLKLYRDQGNRQAFTELAAKLRGDPRFETIAWDMPAEELQRLIAAEG